MSTVFSWNVDDYDDLLRSCNTDPLTPYIFNLFSPDDRILEAGCGSGRFVKYLSDRGYRCVGIEYSSETVADAKQKWPGLPIVEGDVENMPYPENEFKGIISVGVIEHFEEGPEKPLAEMHRVLAPDGVALITVPCLNWLRRLKGPFCGITHMPRLNPLLRRIFRKKPIKRWGWNLYTSRYKYHVRPEWGEFYEYRFTPRQFEEILTNARFEILESVPIHQTDGLYHEFGRLFARWEHWQFTVYPHGRLLNRLLSMIPFCHNHMHLCVVRKQGGRGLDAANSEKASAAKKEIRAEGVAHH